MPKIGFEISSSVLILYFSVAAVRAKTEPLFHGEMYFHLAMILLSLIVVNGLYQKKISKLNKDLMEALAGRSDANQKESGLSN